MTLAVFCGSSTGNKKEYENATKSFGKYLALNNIDVVYGGGKVGLMGILADTVLNMEVKFVGLFLKN